jgi:hypothetical protein
MLGHQAALQRVPLLPSHAGYVERVDVGRLLVEPLLQLAPVDKRYVVAGGLGGPWLRPAVSIPCAGCEHIWPVVVECGGG